MADIKDTNAGGDTTQPVKPRLQPKSPRQALAPEPAPAPAQKVRSKSARNPLVVFLNAVIMLMVIAAIGAGAIVYWGKIYFDAPGPLKTERTVVIPNESGLARIATILEDEGIIDNPYDVFGHYIFIAGVRAYHQQGRLKAGEYAFPAGISMHQVMTQLVEGKAVLRQVTLPEGLTSRQIVDRLNANDALIGDIAEIPPEGSLLPETYSFTRGTTRAQLIAQMQTAAKKALERIWEGRRAGLPIRTPEELVTLASIVEKETGKADERPHVASVFVNRLTHGMRLQSDPTIIYGIAGGAGTLGRPITRSDIDKPSPYNTYHIDGLPPGPIANPGRAALEAVANPSETKDLYFVADGTGGHIFSGSLKEHNRNVANWRKLEKKRIAEGEAEAPDTKDPDAVDVPPEEGDAAPAVADDPMDLRAGLPPKDPNAPVLPLPKPQ